MKKYFLIAVLALGITARPTQCAAPPNFFDTLTPIASAALIGNIPGCWAILNGDNQQARSFIFAGATAAVLYGVFGLNQTVIGSSATVAATTGVALLATKALRAQTKEKKKKKKKKREYA